MFREPLEESDTSPKSTAAVATSKLVMRGTNPVPFKAAERGAPTKDEPLIERLELTEPPAVGVKVTVTTQVAPAAREGAQPGADKVKPGGADGMSSCVDTLPVFSTVIVRDTDSPTFTVPKSSSPELALSEAPVPVPINAIVWSGVLDCRTKLANVVPI